MYQKRENLDILFRRMTPEYIEKLIRKVISGENATVFFPDRGNNFYTFEQYNHFAKMNLPQLSRSELELRYSAMTASEHSDIFLLSSLYQYADEVLVLCEGVPRVRLDKCLAWNSITTRLGQDIFTTAWLAHKDVDDRNSEKRCFDWPAIIKTDDKRLNRMLKKGLAENHFHLHGSTQSFSLSWACIMNHPDYIDAYFKENFKENLNASISIGEMDNVGNWNRRIKNAAMIRALLFAKCMGLVDQERHLEKEYCAFAECPSSTTVKRYTHTLRKMFGTRFEQRNGHSKCLDYACSDYLYEVKKDSDNRLLAGERSFLYQCFKWNFSRKMSLDETLLFYLYLVIKSNFRSEMIQVNERYGFENFSDYQNRKSQFFENFPEYSTEALRLSVCAGIKENYLISLEGRIMPKPTAELMRKEICKLDNIVDFASKKSQDIFNKYSTNSMKGKDLLFYYVVHFPKKKFEEKEFNKSANLLPRNWPTRKKAKLCAKALVKYLLYYDDPKDRRVKGIDACSLEIGCRPETFATEFRYIRGSIRKSNGKGASEIGITYHVGEDFLDITDGLRAIDEVVHFMKLGKGDRLGHAIVLGLEPANYYQLKRNIFWTQQDYLDNIVWILYRSVELNVEISRNNRATLENEAQKLLREIYLKHMSVKTSSNILDLYFRSWKLRGDHPDLYKSGEYHQIDKNNTELYKEYMISDEKRNFDREDRDIALFYYMYHYDKNVKRIGLKAKEFLVGEWYIKLMEDMQKAMRQEIFQKGIAIECNPTSNVKIGTFRLYDRHPMLTFNNHYLEDDDATPNMKVSINTDDLGVFDTSLVNEYALMFDAITKKRHEEGNYNDDAVYDYLNYVRKNGIEMAFKDL